MLCTPDTKFAGCTATQNSLLPVLRQYCMLLEIGQSTNFHSMLSLVYDWSVMLSNTSGDRSRSPYSQPGHWSMMYTTSDDWPEHDASVHETSAQRPQFMVSSHWSTLSAAYLVAASCGQLMKLQLPLDGVLSVYTVP
jgi:hypothetical protein